MTSVAVIIPWGGDCPHRRRALGHVVDWWASIGLPPQVREVAGPWSKGAAANGAILSAGADVVIVADADSLTTPDAVLWSIQSAERHGWAYPHTLVHRLSQDGAQAVYAGADPRGQQLINNRRQASLPGGGIIAATSDVWQTVAGFDPRFVGWGGEDQALGLALRCLVGAAERPSGTILWHLWHPPASLARKGSRENLMLLRRYQLAARRPDRMTELVEEVRCLPDAVSSVTI